MLVMACHLSVKNSRARSVIMWQIAVVTDGRQEFGFACMEVETGTSRGIEMQLSLRTEERHCCTVV